MSESPTDDEPSLDALYPLVYGELRAIAHRHLRGERPDNTLGTTGLVHEAYLKLARLDRIRFMNPAHVLAMAAQAMRRILVDHAVARRAGKRGGDLEKITLDDALALAETRSEELVALDEALQRLGEVSPRCAKVVECRFFGGMTVEETATALAVSAPTVKREWSFARAWLNSELSN